jgi:hypothetical protein
VFLLLLRRCLRLRCGWGMYLFAIKMMPSTLLGSKACWLFVAPSMLRLLRSCRRRANAPDVILCFGWATLMSLVIHA